MLGGMSGQMAISEGWLVILGIFEQFFRHNELSWLLFWINLCMLSSCLLSIAMHLLGKWRETGAASGRRVRGSAWRRWDLLSSQQSLLLLVLSIIHQCLRLSAMYHSVRSEEEKVVLVWKDLTFQTLVKDPKHSTMVKKVYQKRQILKGLSGKAESKQLIAILGPTGCGKTSLLSVLSARFPPGGAGMSSLTGTILLNGRPRDEEHFRKISAYVMQDDHMYAHLTVYETLLMAAHFFLSSSVTDSQKVDIVTTIITELGLLKARDTIIGDEKARGVSGGERKRVSIAVQLLTDPAVLFLDEPTSGLDAFQSQAVMEVLRSLANKGRLVVSVIHQPRSSIYNMFDRLLLLSEGRTMYYGEACLAVKYFTGIGFTCPEHFNPADYFLDLLSPDHRSQELGEETATRINYVGERYLVEEGVTKGGIGKEDDKEGDKGKVVATDNMDIIGEDTEKFVSIRHIGGNEQDFQRSVRTFSLLCWRSWTEQARNLSIIMVKFTVCAFFALIIGGIYSNIGHDQRSIQNRRGVLYFVMINQAFTAIQVRGHFYVHLYVHDCVCVCVCECMCVCVYVCMLCVCKFCFTWLVHRCCCGDY
ncbi:ATP-binding cassette domain-containing protein [archaeon]|nr:MAG: ATP-binding cassette domain-containing protein [archaeon]